MRQTLGDEECVGQLNQTLTNHSRGASEMPTLATLTDREKDTLTQRLRFDFASRASADADDDDGPNYMDTCYDADFVEAVDTHCPEFDVSEIIEATFDFIADPRPGDLRGEQALARTRAYWASRGRSTEDRVKAELRDVYAKIGEDINWFVKQGILLSIFREYPLITYAFALDVNLAGIDAEFFERIEEDAVLFSKLHPDYLPGLFNQLDDFASLTYDELVLNLDNATMHLARKKPEPEDE
jgi:hypothetical protein